MRSYFFFLSLTLFEQIYNTNTEDGFASGAIKQPELYSVNQQFLNHVTQNVASKTVRQVSLSYNLFVPAVLTLHK